MPECIECGTHVSEEEAVYTTGGVKDEGLERLADGETVGIEELFSFDEGPYCSTDCTL